MTFGTDRRRVARVAFGAMAAILTIACELALLGLLWVLWRESARADQEVETLAQGRHCSVDCAPSPAIGTSKFE
jgi:hypothetical protein